MRVVQPPLTGLDQDVAATKRVLDQLDGPVVLVSNSYGGWIITVAGSDSKVRSLVYVSALQPDVGESSAEAARPKAQAADSLIATEDGFIFLNSEKFGTALGADLPHVTADFMAHSQMPIMGAAFDTKLATAAWHEKPSYVIIATEDHELDQGSARRMADRAHSKVSVIKGPPRICFATQSFRSRDRERRARNHMSER